MRCLVMLSKGPPAPESGRDVDRSSSVDDELLAGDPSGLIRHEEADEAGHIFGAAQAQGILFSIRSLSSGSASIRSVICVPIPPGRTELTRTWGASSTARDLIIASRAPLLAL